MTRQVFSIRLGASILVRLRGSQAGEVDAERAPPPPRGRELDGLQRELQAAALDPHVLEERVDHLREALRRVEHPAQDLGLARRQGSLAVEPQPLDLELERRERRAELVRDEAEERALGAAR